MQQSLLILGEALNLALKLLDLLELCRILDHVYVEWGTTLNFKVSTIPVGNPLPLPFFLPVEPNNSPPQV